MLQPKTIFGAKLEEVSTLTLCCGAALVLPLILYPQRFPFEEKAEKAKKHRAQQLLLQRVPQHATCFVLRTTEKKESWKIRTYCYTLLRNWIE